jgi:hypothetical protein
MRKGARTIKVLRILVALALLASVVSLTVAAGAPANAAGTWNFKVSGDAGTADQTIVIQQDGGKITGTFKGPRQSGTINGTVDATPSSSKSRRGPRWITSAPWTATL